MTFTFTESQITMMVYAFFAFLIVNTFAACMSEYQRYKFFKRAKTLKDLEEWKIPKDK